MRQVIETCSGRFVDILEPKVEQIHLPDIAHALALQCRFNGHVRTHYSIAEHCVRVARHMPAPLRIHGLLHDAAEAYLGDIVTPVKRQLAEFAALEDRCLATIYEALAVPLPNPAAEKEVKRADALALKEEAYALLPSRGRWGQGIEPVPPEFPVECWTGPRAEVRWLSAVCAVLGAADAWEQAGLYKQAPADGLSCILIQDNGATEFHGIPTYTALAIGQYADARTDSLTRSLSLL